MLDLFNHSSCEMTFFLPYDPKMSAIIELFAEHGLLSAADLRLKLAEEKKMKVGLSTLYKAISSMLGHKILVKCAGQVCLNDIWVDPCRKFHSFNEAEFKAGVSYWRRGG